MMMENNDKYESRVYCFGWLEGDKCSVLKAGVCACRWKWSKCPFYKSADKNNEELLKYNGTTSLGDIIKRYADEHSGICPVKTESPSTMPHNRDNVICDMWTKGYNRTQIGNAIGWGSNDVDNRIKWLKKQGLILTKRDMRRQVNE